ncbi:MAG: hypothetical protein V4498_03000 [candidate division FCPU426 bacterium]
MTKNFCLGLLLMAALLPSLRTQAEDLVDPSAAATVLTSSAATEMLTETALPLPVSASAEAPILAAGSLDSLTLKNGQRLEGRLGSYDAYFVEIATSDGRNLSLPWKEVADFKFGSTEGEDAAMRRHLSAQAVDAQAQAAPAKDPALIFHKALWPGFVVHGSGYRELGDQDAFLSLVGAEIFGAMVGGFGLAKVLDAGVAPNDKETASYLVWGGATVFVVTWAWDLIGAPAAARRMNQAATPSVSLSPLPGGAMLALNRAF